jgi:hypothetical protein
MTRDGFQTTDGRLSMTRSGIAATRDALQAQSLVLRAIGGEFSVTQEAVLVASAQKLGNGSSFGFDPFRCL